MLKIRSFNFLYLVLSFILLSLFVNLGLLVNTDNFLTISLDALIEKNPLTTNVILAITSMGDVVTMVILAIILTIIRRTRKLGMIFLISIVILSITIMYMKPIIGKESPSSIFSQDFILPENYTIENDSMMPISQPYSFPSNHMARATSFAFLIFYLFWDKTRSVALIWLFPMLIGISRIYLHQHYFTDIVGGFLYGFIITLLLSKLMKLNEPFTMSRFK